MKQLTIFAAFLVFFVGCSQEVETLSGKILFNDSWEFQLLEELPDILTNVPDQNWREVQLPHDWSIEGKSELSNPSKGDGGYFPMGIGLYQKKFLADPAWENKLVSVYFEGIYMNAKVFLNGKPIAYQPYGYTSFSIQLDSLKIGGENTLTVLVDNSKQKNSRWYSGSGIYRNSWLLVNDPLHLAQWGVSILTPEVSKSEATVEIRSTIKNTLKEAREVELRTSLFSSAGAQIASKSSIFSIQAESQLEGLEVFKVPGPELWSPDNPALYSAQIDIYLDDQLLDQEIQHFGIRSIDYNAEYGFKLNGEKIILYGGCVHHDNGCLGAAAYDRAEERKVELLKEAGFNAVRTSHNPPSEAFLDACDRIGLLVIDEAFDGWRVAKTPYDYALYFDEYWQHDLGSMVLRDRNHPSIVMWSIGNEIIERTSPDAINSARMMAEYCRELDPSRPVTSAMTTWGQGWEIFDPLMAEHDIAGYNYQLHYAEDDHDRVPERVILQTESYPKDAFFCWDLVDKHDYIIGDFVWTAMDYLGESGIGRYYYPGEPDGEHYQGDFYPWHGAYCGDIDLTGWRKPISHYRSMLFNGDEKLYMAVREPNPSTGEIKLTSWAVWPTWESWNWTGFTGELLDVEIYSRYPRVQLYLDEELIGEKATGREEEFKAVFSLPYKAGTLKAVGLENGEEQESKILATSGAAAGIRLTADRSEITADGQDLSFITVEIIDEEGKLVPNANILLDFNLNGPGKIIGIDNARLNDPTPYQEQSRESWNGRALVVLRSTTQSGEIILKAEGPGLQEGEVKVISTGG